ncbi:MAG TPA: flagellar assembly protein FliW [Spirochaetales bacterium]|nr:flagellar assembly protein FliW [Spirochaetales bacterium]HPG85113.1 flagellar assembly protein FliW [Spirochaetales bacterium]HPM72104.1 flagellar assembly protein FliW [Spirochaetales bacterium]HQO66424.1 flagellar assembly protein FliW [Spirochaetales bacterium]
MKIQTKILGELDVDERQVIDIPDGLIGFKKFTKYALLDAPQKPYFFLQSTELAELCFILLDPFLFRPDYSVDAADEAMSALGVTGPDDALVLSLVTVPPDGGPVTANLMGPLVIGRKSRRGAQVVLADPRWRTKHDVMAEMAASRK